MTKINYLSLVVAAIAVFAVDTAWQSPFLFAKTRIGESAVQLGLRFWVGFQAMLLTGVLLHEKMPLVLHAIHAGDAFIKTLTVLIGVWRG